MAVVTHRNDTIVTRATKEDEYQITVKYSGEDKIILIEKTKRDVGMMHTERMRLKVPDWEIIKPLVEEALREDEIMRRMLVLMKGNNV